MTAGVVGNLDVCIVDPSNEWPKAMPIVRRRKCADYPPVLTEQEFAALESMCAQGPDVEEFSVF